MHVSAFTHSFLVSYIFLSNPFCTSLTSTISVFIYAQTARLICMHSFEAMKCNFICTKSNFLTLALICFPEKFSGHRLLLIMTIWSPFSFLRFKKHVLHCFACELSQAHRPLTWRPVSTYTNEPVRPRRHELMHA